MQKKRNPELSGFLFSDYKMNTSDYLYLTAVAVMLAVTVLTPKMVLTL